ncbi:MAG: nitrogenase component 1 [Burkholderiaceae bacterium]
MTHSHGRQAAERLGKPLFRLGIPTFDRIGNSHKCYVGYRGTRNLVYEVGNLLMEQIPHHGPDRLAAAGGCPGGCARFGDADVQHPARARRGARQRRDSPPPAQQRAGVRHPDSLPKEPR